MNHETILIIQNYTEGVVVGLLLMAYWCKKISFATWAALFLTTMVAFSALTWMVK